MSDTATSQALDFYSRIGAALFPIPAGRKEPFGIVNSFATDWSKDPAQWERWRIEHDCNFGVVAGPSNIIIADVDVSEVGRDCAWAIWCEWCTANGLPYYAPHVNSARGGWHVLFALPEGFDVSTLRQVALIGPREGSKKAIVDLRVGNGFTVAAGSVYNDNGTQRPYILLSDTPPHVAPDALIAHCARTHRTSTSSNAVGSYNINDVAKLVQWMTDNGAFDDYESWYQIGAALRLELGDAGIDVWRAATWDEVDDATLAGKWESFATEPRPGSITLQSFLKRAHSLGWKGHVGKSASAMFAGVAAIAQAAGAKLSSASDSMLVGNTDKIITALGQPILDNFLAGTADVPTRPACYEYPKLPEQTQGRPLHDLLSTSIDRIIAMAEEPKTFRQGRVLQTLSVLHAFHPEVCEQVCQRISALGGVLNPGDLELAIRRFENRVKAEVRTSAGFVLNNRGEPSPENSDNVRVFFRQRAVKFRLNTWKDQVEVSDADKDAWIQLTDAILNGLLVDAENSQFNYHPSESRFRRGAEYAARENPYDPLRERIDTLASAWDGNARLDTWLSNCVGVQTDTYHTAVGRNLIGGMVRRARYAGCEHAETVIFISPTQGTGKSTLCKILALQNEWHTDSLKFGGSQQNTIPQMAGKWVIELSELAGMNKSAVEEIKNFMSATTDNYTKKYQAFATDHPRRCVFIGTSNDRRPLQDASGGRRFLPVHVAGEVNTDWLRANIEQIIGECAVREATGELFSIPRDVWATANQHQEAARNMTPVEELCHEWFDRPGAFFITATDIGRALKMAGQVGRYAGFLDKMGWRNENLTIPGVGKGRVWVKHDNNLLAQCVRLLPVQSQPNAPVEMRMRLPSTPPGGH